MLARIVPVFAALLLMSPRLAAAETPATYDDTSYDGVHVEWAAGTTAVAPREGPGHDDTSYAGLATTAVRNDAPAEASACHCAKSSPVMHVGDMPDGASSAHKAKHHG